MQKNSMISRKRNIISIKMNVILQTNKYSFTRIKVIIYKKKLSNRNYQREKIYN